MDRVNIWVHKILSNHNLRDNTDTSEVVFWGHRILLQVLVSSHVVFGNLLALVSREEERKRGREEERKRRLAYAHAHAHSLAPARARTTCPNGPLVQLY